jgi:hypothetical protein
MKRGSKLVSVLGLSLVFCSTSRNGPPVPTEGEAPEDFIDSLAEEWLGERDEDPAHIVSVSERFQELAKRYQDVEEDIAEGLDEKPEAEVERYRLYLSLRVDAGRKSRILFKEARRQLLTEEHHRLLRDVPSSDRRKVIRELVPDEQVEALRGKR